VSTEKLRDRSDQRWHGYDFGTLTDDLVAMVEHLASATSRC
jgi:hypothetical protein